MFRNFCIVGTILITMLINLSTWGDKRAGSHRHELITNDGGATYREIIITDDNFLPFPVDGEYGHITKIDETITCWTIDSSESGYKDNSPDCIKERRGKTGSDDDERLLMSASVASASLGESISFTATFTKDDGSPVVGEKINFSVDPDSEGLLSSKESETNSNGQAFTTLTANTIGHYKVTASFGGRYDTSNVEVYDESDESKDPTEKLNIRSTDNFNPQVEGDDVFISDYKPKPVIVEEKSVEKKEEPVRITQMLLYTYSKSSRGHNTQWIELYNFGNKPQSLNGWQIIRVRFEDEQWVEKQVIATIEDVTIEPNEVVLLVSRKAGRFIGHIHGVSSIPGNSKIIVLFDKESKDTNLRKHWVMKDADGNPVHQHYDVDESETYKSGRTSLGYSWSFNPPIIGNYRVPINLEPSELPDPSKDYYYGSRWDSFYTDGDGNKVSHAGWHKPKEVPQAPTKPGLKRISTWGALKLGK